jgi:UDP-N-acetyl-D-mannosaminuronic acid dehydrogenase
MQHSKSNRFKALITLEASISDAIVLMGGDISNKFIAGIAVIVDDDNRVIGVLTDGDVRRGLSQGLTVESCVKKIANFSPLMVDRSLNKASLRQAVIREARRRNSHYFKYGKIILVEPDGRFFDVIYLSDILTPQIEEKTIAVYGLGFVGLTLAATFANAGVAVVGIDLNKTLIEKLQHGIAPFYEKGLDSLLTSLATKNPIQYTSSPSEFATDVHIVSVGTPVDSEGSPNLKSITLVCEMIVKVLKPNDMVIFRSTLPIGTMRNVVLPILESSGLKGGLDFGFAFAPERTIEGKALEELRTLPQIIGGIDKASTNQAAAIFGQITRTIVEVESLEASELVKLINNTFRDLVFSFANEVASICDGYNINAFDLIRAANEGYPRDKIPLPSPGVGGICLSKDPYLYTNPIKNTGTRPILGLASRQINRSGPDYILSKIEKFCEQTNTNINKISTLLIGIAFKGTPETSDTRGSVALDLLDKLPSKDRLLVKDFVVPAENIEALGYNPAVGELDNLLENVNVVIVMNNHYRNNKFNVIEALKRNPGPILFFDGWNMFDQREIESLDHVYYATMGYMTKPK